MAKYLCRASYAATAEGTKGLLKEGDSKRRAQVAETVKSKGGKLESFYYPFGDEDVLAILDLPDNATAAALSLAVSASGTVTSESIALLTPEEIDQAASKTVSYHPPGQQEALV